MLTDGGDPRPAVLVLLVNKWSFKTQVVNLIDLPHWLRQDYVIVARDPFTMDHWQAWRRRNPEAE